MTTEETYEFQEMKLPVVISYFICFCHKKKGAKWKVFRDQPQYTSKCQYCFKKIRKSYFRYINTSKSNICASGSFYCTKCANYWTSAHSWILYKQKCFYCNKKVFPYSLKQHQNWGSSKQTGGPKKNHKKELCDKCKELGYECKNFAYEDDDDKYYYYGGHHQQAYEDEAYEEENEEYEVQEEYYEGQEEGYEVQDGYYEGQK